MTLIPVLTPDAMQGRFDWAFRRGLKQWLWPDIAPQAWHRSLDAIVKVTGRVLAGQAAGEMLDGDPLAISLAAYTSGMGPLLGYWIETGKILASAEVAAILAKHLSQNRRRMIKLQTHAVRMAERLTAAGIRPLLIKGMHTAFAYFPTPDVRPMSDIDIVVPPARLRDAERVFAKAGYVHELLSSVPYQCAWRPKDTARLPRTLLCVHADDPWGFDLQTTISRYLNNGGVVELDDLHDAAAAPGWRLSGTAAVLSQPLLLLLLAAHASQMQSSLTLIRLVELILVIRKDMAAGALSWERFLAELHKAGPRFVYPAFAFCEQLAPGTIPGTVLSVCENDAPPLLRKFVSRQSLSTLQGLEQHSLMARYMWADSWVAGLGQLIREFRQPDNKPLTWSNIWLLCLNRAKVVFHLAR